ncbi:phosphodiesterase [Sphingobium chlorophenolicum]|uniref:3',5'-cyclic adenosine monophosphate phosphodiesterase CpdA n=1 Tax=Sphingobium chlorophenolicum TaxID=46429 RepID=A0A081R8T0_SPHCR|nr:phosphodiesterase [Sphingobium chlorophenolicum]KEQ51603.1 3',5'-cyclic adenosine monophosphate phosphodiesterase CpdA [Sphingobium chlorophenolicum]
MLIAQVTDIHLGFDPDNPAEFNRKRLDQVLRALNDGPNRPDLLLATGDLTDRGDADSYRRLANAFSQCDFPVWPCMGNHDDRAQFAQYFPHIPQEDGFVHYVIPLEDRRIIMLDTLEPDRHGGAFCERRAAWLSARLDEDSTTPTLIVMHHPPVEVGIDWMNTHPEEAWVQRFTATIAGRPNIQAILCGHIHRAITAPWQGTTIAICSSTAPQLVLDMRPMDPDAPDNRPMIVADPPAYALHRWTDHGLITHFATADDHVMLAKFDAGMQSLVRTLIDERPA